MKKQLLKIVIVIGSLVALNMPLFFVAKRNYISQEQPDFPATFEQRLDVADKTFAPRKQLFTASKDGLIGFSLLISNSKPFEKQTLKLQLYSVENLEKPLLSKNYSLSPDYLSSVVSLTFDQIPDSQNKQFIVLASLKNTPREVIKKSLSENAYTLNARPLYSTSNVLKDIYYRTSQYKPSFLKNPSLVIAYLAFNIIFSLLIIELIRTKKSTD